MLFEPLGQPLVIVHVSHLLGARGHRGMTPTENSPILLPVIPMPSGLRFQPVDSGEVADRMVELALGAPAGLVPDMAGPQIYPLADLVRSYLEATGKRRLLVPVPVPGRAARAVRDGAVIAPNRAVGRRTWEEFLAGVTRARSSALPS
jgi:uncharacterized protein YbjT (DUF2867 family)